MKQWSALALLLAVAGALILRTSDLGNRPLHNDEAINATKLAVLYELGEYQYDPHEFHGPSLYYFSLPFIALSGVANSNADSATPPQNPTTGEFREAHAVAIAKATFTDAQLRLVAVGFGVALLLLVLLLRDGLGDVATAWSAWFLAVSPAFVFYSRYFIHEMLLVFFTLATLAAGWRYWRTPRPIWAALTGASLGLMIATKETFVLTVAAMGFGVVAAAFWNRWRLGRVEFAGTTRGVPPAKALRLNIPTSHLLLAGVLTGSVWLLFFTSFFTNSAGPLDSLRTYQPWLQRAGGASPHIQPWWFYFERLLWFHPAKSPPWTEAALLLLALIGMVAGFGGNRARVAVPSLVRFLSFFTLALAAIYTVIGYKTPWCALNFWLGVILLAGVGAAVLIASVRGMINRLLMNLLLGAVTLHLGVQAWLLTHQLTADRRNPYTYAQTSPHERELTARIKAIAHVSPDGLAMAMKVISPDSYWPLPWTLRELTQVGWYEQLPEDPYAPVVLCSARLGAALDDRSNKRWIMTGLYELRPGFFLELYVERGLWEKFVATLPRDAD